MESKNTRLKKTLIYFTILLTLFFSISCIANADENNSSLDDEGETSLSADTSDLGQVAMYRLYNKWSGEHFYTTNKDEKAKLVKIGWSDEDLGWNEFVSNTNAQYVFFKP